MNDTPEKRLDDSGDELTTLFGRVAARERPSEAAEAAAFAALHTEWREGTATRRRRRTLTVAAAAAASLTVATLGFLWLQSPSSTEASLATIDLVQGTDVTWRDDRSQAQSLGARRELADGERLATGPTSRVALRWHDGGSLRLDANSRLELVSADAVRLTAGSLYFDSTVTETRGATAAALAVHTPAGEVVHVGTQFMVTVAGDEVVLSVREGEVKVTGDGFELVVAANEELGVRSNGTREVTAIDGHGDRWTWASEIAPPIELEGRTTFEVVEWAARETGRRVVYESLAAETKARDNVLHGIDRRSPSGILTLLPYLTELGYEARDDAIVVSEP